MEFGAVTARRQQVALISLLALLVCACNRAPGVRCQNASFTFVPGDQGFTCTYFCNVPESCHNNPGCEVVGTTLQLIPDTGGRTNIGMAARYMRDEAVQLWHTSFSTFFVLQVSMINVSAPDYYTGDGMAFLIASNETTPAGSDGGGVGLFNKSGTGSWSHPGIVAILFDTYPDAGDVTTPNVGLLVNSETVSAVGHLVSEDFFGHISGVWVEYDVSSMVLDLSMLKLPPSLAQPSSDFTGVATTLRQYAKQIFSFRFNVTASVDEYSYLGFSAGTGRSTEINEIFYWQFEILPHESPFSLPAPAASPEQPPAPEQEAGPGPSIQLAPPSGNVVQELKDARSGHGGARLGVVIAAALIGSAVVTAALLSVLWCWHRGSSSLSSRLIMKGGDGDMGDHRYQAAVGPRIFSYKELLTATEHFGASQVLGEGGFGKVYKGQLKNGTVAAVKRISQHSRQGEKEFLAEVTIIERLRHKNLVPLLGWCRSKDKGELLLVYQYMPNGSLDQQLHPQTDTSGGTSRSWPSVLGWEARYHILQGVASALLYLHDDWQEAGLQQAVVHRDIKTSNVLLDAQWNARLGDFGLARLVDKHSRVAISQTASRVVGTRGYLAPEYASTGRVSVQADVYSFGVLVLEVVTGRRSVDWTRPPWPFVLVDWVRLLHQQTKHIDDISGAEFKLEDAAADPALGGHFKPEQLLLLLRIGLKCTAHEPSDRPSMRQVVKFLSAAEDMYRTLLPESLPVMDPTTAAPDYSFGDGSNPGSGNSRPRSSLGTNGTSGTSIDSSRVY